MDQEIDRAPHRLHLGENRIDRGRVGNVAMPDDEAADLLGKRLDALLERVALIGERKLGAVTAAGFGDAPGQRALVGDPDDQAALAAHEARDFRHFSDPADISSAGPPMA